MSLVAVRGATTSASNDPASIGEAAKALLRALGQANPAFTPASTVAIFFTATPDLDAAFAAAAARSLGWDEAALLGAMEVAVPGAPARCIRVLALFLEEAGAPAPAGRGVPVYLGQAACLRPDLGLPAGGETR